MMGFVGVQVSATGGKRSVNRCERRRLVRALASSSVGEEEGATPADKAVYGANEKLFEAAKKQDVDGINEALEGGASVLATDLSGRTAIHFLAAIGVTPTLKSLVEKGGEVDAQDEMGLTALHMAAGYARPKTVELLLEMGANVTLQDNSGKTAYALVEKLLENEPEKKFFMRNQKYDNLTEIRAMLKGRATAEVTSEVTADEAELAA